MIKKITDLSLPSLQSLLADCYWTMHDGYAHYVWRRLEAARQRALVETWPVAAAYLRHIRNVDETNLARESDIAYLNPLPIYHLDTEAVTALVRKHPIVYSRLSLLRRESLGLSQPERTEIQNLPPRGTLPDFGVYTASPARVLRNFEGTLAVTASEPTRGRGIGIEMKERVVTLAWLMDLSEAEVTNILSDFSARELATAWIGPVKLLAHLDKCLPEEKREQVASHREREQPSREAEAYVRLHRRAIAALRKTRPEALEVEASNQEEEPSSP